MTKLNPLEEEIQKLRQEVSGETATEVKTDEEATEDAQEEKTDDATKTDEPVKEEVKTDDAKPAQEELKPDAAAFARLRREAAEARREADELKKAQQAKENPEKKQVEQEPNKAENYEAWLEWQLKQTQDQLKEAANTAKEVKETIVERQKREEMAQLEQAAIQQLTEIESDFKKKAPDYDDAAMHVKSKLIESYSLLYPNANEQQIRAAADKYIFDLGVMAYQQGYNPAEYLYHMSKGKFGYAPVVKQVAEEKKKEIKPDLKKIDENRKRSLTGAVSGGQGGATAIGLDAIGDMTYAQFSRLTPAQREELKAQSR